MRAPGVSDTKLVEGVLTLCPICGVEGPKAREREHMTVDHRIHEKAVGGNYIVAIPKRFRPMLEAKREATGATITRLLAIALDDYYGCHVSVAQEPRA